MYAYRALGGSLYLIGVILMMVNLWKTAKSGKLETEEQAEAPPLVGDHVASATEHWHRKIERKPWPLLVLTLVVILIGGLIEMVPTFLVKSNIPTIASVEPYTPLELHGRDLYIREGCYTCHSQMVRPFRSETERYGEYAKAGEYIYDHPFQWGSKRTGPDLLRVGGKYPDSWHYLHTNNPTSISPGSIMPKYPWLYSTPIDTSLMASKINAMITLGVPYPEHYATRAVSDMKLQAEQITTNLKTSGIEAVSNTEIIALIAYLQRLGTDIKGTGGFTRFMNSIAEPSDSARVTASKGDPSTPTGALK
jgi:cytochrome c oxidase cbb3-type subunit I/II